MSHPPAAGTVGLLFSGGTDSTAAAVIAQQEFAEVRLLTCSHSGLRFIENSHVNALKLRERFGAGRFPHWRLEMDGLFRRVTYDSYFSNIVKFGLFNLSSCGLCKLAMHLRVLIYCAENGIPRVMDGANHNMSHFPAQMAEVIEELRRLYRRFGIHYSNPVFQHDFPDDLDWFAKVGLRALTRPRGEALARTGPTTGEVIAEAGLAPATNVKGTEYDRRMQARCFQLTLLNAFALGHYIPRHGMERYRSETLRFFKAKLAVFGDLVERHLADPARSPLAPLLPPAVPFD
jgi:predicted subunit of tRNA(5-methylaminomethyl-2-thiouridylate) methyltransferase